jgi:hypothetical protein
MDKLQDKIKRNVDKLAKPSQTLLGVCVKLLMHHTDPYRPYIAYNNSMPKVLHSQNGVLLKGVLPIVA